MRRLKKFQFLDSADEGVSSLRVGSVELVFVLLNSEMVIDFSIGGNIIETRYTGSLLGKAFMTLAKEKRFAIMEKMLIARFENYLNALTGLKNEVIWSD